MQMCALPAQPYATPHTAIDWDALPADSKTLVDNRENKGDGLPVLNVKDASAYVRADGFVLFPATATAEAAQPLPPTCFRKSGEALLSGKTPGLVLALRAVAYGDAAAAAAGPLTPLRDIAGCVSETFHVTTTRTRSTVKVAVPSSDTEVRFHAVCGRASFHVCRRPPSCSPVWLGIKSARDSITDVRFRALGCVRGRLASWLGVRVQLKKIEHIGNECQEKLRAFAATAERHDLVVPAGCEEVTVVSQLRRVVAANGHERERRLYNTALRISPVRALYVHIVVCFIGYLARAAPTANSLRALGHCQNATVGAWLSFERGRRLFVAVRGFGPVTMA